MIPLMAAQPGPRTGRGLQRARRRRLLTWTAGLILALAALGILTLPVILASRPTVTRTVTRPASLPASCRTALQLARRVAPNAAELAAAAHRHAELMDRLDLFLDGKKGGLSGQQVYQRGAPQMRVFESRGPPTHRQALELQEATRQCTLR